jgi:hypothetical protein
MQASEVFAGTVGKRPPVVQYTSSQPAFSPPDEGSIPDQEYGSMTEKAFYFERVEAGAEKEETSAVKERPGVEVGAGRDDEKAPRGITSEPATQAPTHPL